MMNLVLRVRYVLMKRWNITPKIHKAPDAEYAYTDYFTNLWHWVPTQPETVRMSRRDGATLLLKQVDNKSFMSPCIISKDVIKGGGFIVTVVLNSHEKTLHYFLLRRQNEEIGFKVNQDLAYIIYPKIATRKLKIFEPEKEHKFEVEIDPMGTICWRIDDITVHKEHFLTVESRHVMIGMSVLQSKINPKELPLSFKLKSVSFYHNHLYELKRNNNERIGNKITE